MDTDPHGKHRAYAEGGACWPKEHGRSKSWSNEGTATANGHARSTAASYNYTNRYAFLDNDQEFSE